MLDISSRSSAERLADRAASMALEMIATGLRISWATALARRPIAASFSSLHQPLPCCFKIVEAVPEFSLLFSKKVEQGPYERSHREKKENEGCSLKQFAELKRRLEVGSISHPESCGA